MWKLKEADALKSEATAKAEFPREFLTPCSEELFVLNIP